jgi:hypothetical protein
MRSVEQTIVWVKDDRIRRLVYAAMAVIAAILIFFPRPYVASAQIVPQDTAASASSTTALLGALGGQATSIGSLLSGGRPSNDLYLVLGRSDAVKRDVIRTLNLVGPHSQFTSERKALLWMDRHVDVHLLLGGVMEIETKLYNPARAQQITAVYAKAIGRSLATFGRQITANKRKVVELRFGDSKARVADAEAQLADFRRVNNLAEPEQQLGNALSQRANLEAELQAKQVQYRTQSQLLGPENAELIALQSDIAGLQQQIARSTQPATEIGGPNVAGLTAVQLRYLDLYRNLRFQQALYEIYQRSAEQVAVEELATESASYVQVIDNAHVDSHRQYNNWAIGLLAGVILLALFTEWYVPASGLYLRGKAESPVKLFEQE